MRRAGGASVIARNCRGHVGDQRSRAAVDDRQQLLADLPGIGHVDMPRKRYHRLPAGPPYWVEVLKHGGRPGIHGKAGVTQAL